MNVDASRAEVQTVKCPECGADVGQVCEGVRKPRTANHVGRQIAWLEWIDRITRRRTTA